MDVAELRSTLHDQYVDACLDAAYKKSRSFRRAANQVRTDMETLDRIMARNFGMAYNPDLKIYE